MSLRIIAAAVVLAWVAPARAQTSCSYYQQQASYARSQIKNCEHGLSAAQKSDCIRTFQKAAANYDAEYRSCVAKRNAASSSGGGGGGVPANTAAAVADVLGKMLDRHRQDQDAAREAQRLREQLDDERRERERLARELEQLQRQQRLQALKAELDQIYQRRGAWSRDQERHHECDELAWAMVPKACEKAGHTRPTTRTPADEQPKVTPQGCADGTDFVEFSCRTPVPPTHHGCRTVTPSPFDTKDTDSSGCGHRWGCCLTPADRDLVAGKPKPVDTCTYDPWGPGRKATISESAQPARLWTVAECRTFAANTQGASRDIQMSHDADAQARRTVEAAQATLPLPHCCAERGHVTRLVEIARALHSQFATVKAELARGARCSDMLRQPEINLQNLTSRVEWELGIISEDPKTGGATSGPYHTWSSAVGNWELGASDFATLCTAMAAYHDCLAKPAPKGRRK